MNEASELRRGVVWAFAWLMAQGALLAWAPAGGVVAVAHGLQLLPPLALGALAWRRARREQGSRRRWAWHLIALGAAAWTGGHALWGWAQLTGGTAAKIPALAHAGFLGMLVLVLAATLLLSRLPSDAADRARAVIDAVVAWVTLLVLSWPYMLEPLLHAGLSAGGLALALVYPVGHTLVAATALSSLAWAGAARRSVVLLGAGLLLFAVGDQVVIHLLRTGAYPAGHWIELLWAAAFLFMALAAVAPADPAADGGQVRVGRTWLLLPYAPLLVAAPVLVVEFGHDDSHARGMVAALAALVVLVLARQSIVLSVHGTSARRLAERVEERTRDLARAEDRFAVLTGNVADAVAVLGADGDLRYVSSAVERLLDVPARHVTPEAMAGLLHPDDVALIGAAIATVRTGSPTLPTIVRMRRGEQWRSIEIELRQAPDAADRGDVVLTARDVTDRVRAERQLAAVENRDSLSGLLNRPAFLRAAEEAMAGARARGESVGMLLMDLDGFQTVNDSLGHDAGDALLALAGKRVASIRWEGGLVARLGGDEFGVLVRGADASRRLGEMGSILLGQFRSPFSVAGTDVVVTASVGLVRALPEWDAAQLLTAADTALYAAKSEGRNRAEFFAPVMVEAVRERLRLRTALAGAVGRGEVELWYQPVVDVRSRRTISFEALMRWRSPEHGLVSPARFIPLAEETGLILELGEWALHQACATLAGWRHRHPAASTMNVAVNVSGRQLATEMLPVQVQAALDTAGLPPESLTIEMTESLAQDDPLLLRRLQALRSLGVRLSLDDFGTGYSSLSSLQHFPFHTVKLDRSFVEHQSSDDARGRAFLRAIAELSRSLDLTTIAEGIETAEQFDVVRSAGIDAVQGYLLGRPAPAADLESFLAAGALPPSPKV